MSPRGVPWSLYYSFSPQSCVLISSPTCNTKTWQHRIQSVEWPSNTTTPHRRTTWYSMMRHSTSHYEAFGALFISSKYFSYKVPLDMVYPMISPRSHKPLSRSSSALRHNVRLQLPGSQPPIAMRILLCATSFPRFSIWTFFRTMNIILLLNLAPEIVCSLYSSKLPEFSQDLHSFSLWITQHRTLETHFTDRNGTTRQSSRPLPPSSQPSLRSLRLLPLNHWPQ